MKHFYISLLIFLSIIAGCVYETSTVNTILSYIETENDYLYKQTFINDDYIHRVHRLRDFFCNKKNMLQLFVNKEHIYDIELNILLLENYTKLKDIDACKEKNVEISSAVSYMKGNQTAVD